METLIPSQGLGLFFGALLAVSEVLSLLPKVRANGIFQLAVRLLKGLDFTAEGNRAPAPPPFPDNGK
jgi:hypothetical protein